jgi:hypothetical protein
MLGSFLCSFQFDKAGHLVPRRTRAAGNIGAKVMRPPTEAAYGEESHGMVWPDNIDSGHASFQLDTRYSGCRRTLDYLLSIHRTLKHAAVSSTDHGGGKRRGGGMATNRSRTRQQVRQGGIPCASEPSKLGKRIGRGPRGKGRPSGSGV